MSLWPVAVELGELELPLAEVPADLVIRHGRADVFSQPSASTCQLSILGPTRAFSRAFRVGLPLRVMAADDNGVPFPRFTGRITDARLEADELVAIATGRLATLRDYTIGAAGVWPVEAWSARVERLFVEAGLDALLELEADPDFDPLLAARDPATAGPTTLGDYLTFLAPMIGAAVADTPDGRILVQAVAARTLSGPFELDPELVAFAPPWEQVLPLGNIVTVRYTGDQSESVTVDDPASIALYGERRATIDTTFVDLEAATTRAESRLERGAYARWNMTQAPILAGLRLELGRAVLLSSLPASAPHSTWTPLLEGWQDRIAEDEWTMRLSLTDPLDSGLTGLSWETTPPEIAWAEVNPETAWHEATDLDSLLPGRRRARAR